LETRHRGRDSNDDVTRPFSLSYKQKIVERLSGKGAASATQLARETGIRQQTLSRWLRDARTLPLMPPEKRTTKVWSIDEKVRVLAAASKLTGEDLTGFLQREGLSLAQLEQWRMALDEEGRASKAVTKRIHGLERELARKEKALAEAAALLVLKKKVDQLWEDADDDTDEESDK
jgi:transposase